MIPTRDIALFDFDGTITDNDNYTAFLRVAVPPRRLAWGRVVLAPVVLAYKAGLLSGPLARRAVTWIAFRGLDAAAVRARGEAYAREAMRPRVRPEAARALAAHRAKGDTVVVVSASLDAYMAPWCAAEGLDLVCSALEERGGRLTGRYAGGDCTGAEKARRVRARYDLASYARVHAYGDTEEDRELLALAHRKVFRWQEEAGQEGAPAAR